MKKRQHAQSTKTPISSKCTKSQSNMHRNRSHKEKKTKTHIGTHDGIMKLTFVAKLKVTQAKHSKWYTRASKNSRKKLR